MSDCENDFNEETDLNEIKKIVDQSRNIKKKYSKEDRIKNLQLAREKKSLKVKDTNKNTNKDFKDTNKDLKNTDDIKNIIEELIKNQNQYFEKIISENTIRPKKINSKKTNTIKQNKRTLDITVSDNEIKNIIENKNDTKEEIKKDDNLNVNPKLLKIIEELKKK